MKAKPKRGTVPKKVGTHVGEGIAFALVLLALLATAFAFRDSLSSVKWLVDDKDPQSYAGVVFLMLAVQLIFFFSGKLGPKPDAVGAGIGIACYLVAGAVLIWLPGELSLNFWLFRLDLLALPLFLIGSIALLFGWEVLLRLKYALLYSLLACPLIFAPIIALEPALTNATADFTHWLAGLLSLPVERLSGNFFITPLDETPIQIVAACAGLAAYLAFLAFVLPLAYLLNGSWKRRLAWLLGGLVLIIALNFARIFATVYIWQSSGLDNAVGFFNSFGGDMLFNIALLAAIIAIPILRLSLPRLRGVSLLSSPGKALAGFASSFKGTGKVQLLAVAGVILAAAAFSTQQEALGRYSWLSYYEGKEFEPAQANPAAMPYPDEWLFLGSETSFSGNLTVTQMVFDYEGKQIQATVLSSGERSMLGFRAEESLNQRGYSIESAESISLGMGITGWVVTYSKEGAAYSTLYWSQPAQFMGKFTYAALLFTVSDDARNEAEWLKEVGKEFVSQFGPG